jgi:redox-sensitive bicupin YhaK (pirin superfamily)
MVDTKVAAQPCEASGVKGSVFEKFPAHEATVGTLRIVRALPIRQKRLVGAWCFLDRFGPLSFSEAKPMDVAPHPHIGLQTVSWLLQGEVVHNDSLGSVASFEHAALLVTGDAEIDGQSIDSMNLYYLGTNRSSVEFKSRDGCRVLLIGGPPFPEKILMWWNFVARTSEEIAQARSDWQSHQRFGEVRYQGPRLDAPPLKRFAPPNPAS